MLQHGEGVVCGGCGRGGRVLFLGKNAKQTKMVREMGWQSMLHSPNSTTAEE